MKTSTFARILILIIIIGGITFIFNQASKNGKITNREMLKSKSNLPILKQENVEYFPGAKGYLVRPLADGVYPGVVMIHENRGLRPEIKSTAEDLAKEGYVVLAVDLFRGEVLETQEEARAKTSTLDQKQNLENLKAAVKYLKLQGAPKIASLGWCFGGRQSVELSISGEKLDATIVYYGGGMATSTDKLKPINWPVLGIFGDQDKAIPIDMVKTFENSLNTLGIENEIYIYPGVGHAFANPSGMNYAPEATKDAWEKTLLFLKKNIN